MTDVELDSLEEAAKEATEIVGWNVPAWEAYTKSINPATILELIEKLRQAWAERDWLAKMFAASPLCPVDQPDLLIEIAKEATCQK